MPGHSAVALKNVLSPMESSGQGPILSHVPYPQGVPAGCPHAAHWAGPSSWALRRDPKQKSHFLHFPAPRGEYFTS